MKTISKMGVPYFQGDVCFIRVEKLPDDAKPIGKSEKRVIVAHSETGHHHVAVAEKLRLYGTDDPMVCYLVSESAYADVVHERSFDTHETYRLDGPVWKVIGQRESTPEGWRRAAD
jgi:hypothetical protein